MNYTIETNWTDTQKKAIAIIPKFSSILSIVGSIHIILYQDDSKKVRKFQSSTYNRLLMIMSFYDITSSFGCFFSTWAIPKDDDQGLVVYNIGNQNTCNLQGFLLHFGNFGAVFYNAFLSAYFCQLVRAKISNNSKNSNYNKNRCKLDNERMELVFHILILLFAISTAIYPTWKGYMNPTPSHCYINDFPVGCVNEECIRGEHFKLFRIYLSLVPISICILVITISMIMLYVSVKNLERQTIKSSTSTVIGTLSVEINNMASNLSNNEIEQILKDSEGDGESDNVDEEEKIQRGNSTSESRNPNKDLLISQASKKVQGLSFRYVIAFLSIWLPMILINLYNKFIKGNAMVSFWFYLVLVILSPLQGYHNALIFRGFNTISCFCQFSDFLHVR